MTQLVSSWVRSRAWSANAALRALCTGCAAAIVLSLCIRQVGEQPVSAVWDDALFFWRVARNVWDHGVAAWNAADGPVFVNTSQWHQFVAVVLWKLFPGRMNAAMVGYAALSLLVLWRALSHFGGPSVPSALLALALLQAPPVLLSVLTGMETAGVLAIVSLTPWLLDRAPRWQLWGLAGAQCLAFWGRPDALLLTSLAAAAWLAAERRYRVLFALAALSAIGVALSTAAYWAYYGTPVPLAAYLKITPVSSYDANYLGLGTGDKHRHLLQFALIVLPSLPLVARRLDAKNLALCGAATAFIVFHALMTSEIMGYHARFYAPSLVLIFAAAMRAMSRSSRTPAWLVLACSLPGALATWAYHGDAIAREGPGLDSVSVIQYLAYFACVPLAVLSRVVLPRTAGGWALGAAILSLTTAQIWPVHRASWTVRRDDTLILEGVRHSSALKGLEWMHQCFQPEVSLTHSELGLPGVYMPKARVIDLTGLANPSIARGNFDFETLCEQERPDFVFRPHWTHRRFNRILDQSSCLKKRYRKVPQPHGSSAPLHVRRDLLESWRTCKPEPDG